MYAIIKNGLFLCTPTAITIGFNQTSYTVIEGSDDVIVYVAVLEGDLQSNVSVIISTHILVSETGAGESVLVITFINFSL